MRVEPVTLAEINQYFLFPSEMMCGRGLQSAKRRTVAATYIYMFHSNAHDIIFTRRASYIWDISLQQNGNQQSHLMDMTAT